MASYKLLLLPGDGIGPEVAAGMQVVLEGAQGDGLRPSRPRPTSSAGCALDAMQTLATRPAARQGCGRDPARRGRWAEMGRRRLRERPEAGLLRLRKELDLFANHPSGDLLPGPGRSSALKRELVEGLDIMIVRELTGGVYFGERRRSPCWWTAPSGRWIPRSTPRRDRADRPCAFDLAGKRSGRVASAEKHNVMMSGSSGRRSSPKVHAEHYADLQLEHILADTAHAAGAPAEAVRRG